MNTNTKTLELVAGIAFAYPSYSVLLHSKNVEKQYHQNLVLDFLLKYEVDFPSLFYVFTSFTKESLNIWQTRPTYAWKEDFMGSSNTKLHST